MKVFITGGTSGLGLSLAVQYAKIGHEVGICGRDLSKIPQEHTGLKAYECDVTDHEKLKANIEDFAAGKLDILIANAGIDVREKYKIPVLERSIDVINTNLIGVINTFDIGIPIMRAQGGGQLVAISSVAGLIGLPGVAAYSASKAAVIKLCESYTVDLIDYGIHTTVIAPGFIDTPMVNTNAYHMPFLLDAPEAAKRIIKAIAAKPGLRIIPWQMAIIVTILEKIPRPLYRLLIKTQSKAIDP